MSRVKEDWKVALGCALALVVACSGAAGCDDFEPSATVEPSAAERAAEKAKGAAREAIIKVMKAAETATATCAAGDLRWEADDDGNVVSRHYSRPCIPERCTPTPADIESLRTSARALKSLIDGETSLQVPSYQGFVLLADAMVGFADTALASSVAPKDKPLQLSGLSMHYGALAAAFRDLYTEPVVALEPPSLTTSLAVPAPGGDVCKGWALPQYCDVSAVRLPKDRKWRTDPPCIEVEGVRK